MIDWIVAKLFMTIFGPVTTLLILGGGGFCLMVKLGEKKWPWQLADFNKEK